MGTRLWTAWALGTALVMTAWPTREAAACGGCFVPTETNTVVTDHRMILSISPGQSTLYDQIRYQGDPSSFAWILPIRGEAEVGLSADALFGVLDARTAPRVQGPSNGCPAPRCGGGSGCLGSSDSAFDSANAGGADGVAVTRQETVGPYETVQLAATDAGALERWLDRNGYAIPQDVQPVLAAYVAGGFDFLAMKLVPGAGVAAMRPVRVTTRGASPTLPLRMVAAGTGSSVGITLWVVAEGRYEPDNFPTYRIRGEDLAWDWTRGGSSYAEVRAAKTAATEGRGWEIESSLPMARGSLEYAVAPTDYADDVPPPDAGAASADAGPAQPTDPRARDLDALFAGIAPERARVTRLRADLARSALAEDLRLSAAQDPSAIDTVRVVSREIGEPQCPIYDGCETVGTAPRELALKHAREHGYGPSAGNGGCNAAPRATARSFVLLTGAAVAAALLRRRSREKRRR